METRIILDRSLAEAILEEDKHKPPVPRIIMTSKDDYFYDTDGKVYKGAYRDDSFNWFYKNEKGEIVQCPKNTIW